MAKKNTKVTEAQKKQAIKEVKNAQDAYNIPGQIDPKKINLVTEYLTHNGQIVRKSKSAETRAKNEAKRILAKRIRLIDAVRIMVPALNTLQSEYISQQQASRIIVDMLKHHGYKTQDLFAAAKRQAKASSKHRKDIIKGFQDKYIKEHSSKSKGSKKSSKKASKK